MESICSSCGVQQCYPLGPLGIALSLHPIIERINTEVPNFALNAWYLDDGTLAGSSGDLGDALNIIERLALSVSLHLNRGKSVLFISSESDLSQSPIPSEIPITCQGFCILGCRIGPPSFSEKVLRD